MDVTLSLTGQVIGVYEAKTLKIELEIKANANYAYFIPTNTTQNVTAQIPNITESNSTESQNETAISDQE